MRWVVTLARDAQKQVGRVPRHIADKLLAWAQLVQERGLPEVRRIPGFHDEPLKGHRKGQRSVRLSIHYRAVYTVADEGTVQLITVEEVTKHDY
jgi:toxin HigB-1